MNEKQAQEQKERAERIKSETGAEDAKAQKVRWAEVENMKALAVRKADIERDRLVQQYLIEMLGDADDIYLYKLEDQVVDVGLSNEFFPYSRADRLSTKFRANVSVIDRATGETLYVSDKWKH